MEPSNTNAKVCILVAAKSASMGFFEKAGFKDNRNRLIVASIFASGKYVL